jgi:hypothetical protein
MDRPNHNQKAKTKAHMIHSIPTELVDGVVSMSSSCSLMLAAAAASSVSRVA